jgi:ATP-binding cassette, subfamily B, multidrug efflux pump
MQRPKPERRRTEGAPMPFMRHGPHGMHGAEIKRAKDARAAIRRLWGYLRRQKAALIDTACMVTVGVLLNVSTPYLVTKAIDGYIIKHDLAGLGRICLLMLAIYAVSSALVWLQSYIMAGASQRTVRDIRDDLFTRLQVYPLRFFDQRAHGDLMSRLTNDVENVNMVLASSVTQIVSGLLSMVGVAIAMFVINVPLAMVTLGTVTGTALLLNRWVAKRTREGFRRRQSTLGTLNGLIEETISGQRVVKAYHREKAVLAEFETANAELRKSAATAEIYAGFVGPLMNCVGNMGLAIVAAVGGGMAAAGTATVGTIAGFIFYARQFGRPVNEIASLYNSIQAALAGAERVFDIIDQPAEVDAVAGEDCEPIVGDVVFDDVSFGYEAGSPVLKNVSLNAKAGELIALVGPTGAGKTTIVNLLTRFYEIDEGIIEVDGRDLRTFRKDDLRRQLGIVLQDSFLFSGTVRENIRYGKPSATDEEIAEAARLANADLFIHRLPHGYDTELSERAGNLSHGQRQLVAIARAILADPRILILDEATSSVDTRTEKHIQEATKRLMKGRTSFVIAHRLSTIRDADQILVVNHGEIMEHGTHRELLAQKGLYWSLNARKDRTAAIELTEA